MHSQHTPFPSERVPFFGFFMFLECAEDRMRVLGWQIGDLVPFVGHRLHVLIGNGTFVGEKASVYVTLRGGARASMVKIASGHIQTFFLTLVSWYGFLAS